MGWVIVGTLISDAGSSMRLTIRSKVLLLSLTLFTIPYVGYEYVREMEEYLRDSLETSLKDTARALASVLSQRPTLFSRRLLDTVREDKSFVTYDLKSPIQLDGDISDWGNAITQASEYADQHILKNLVNYSPQSLSFQYLLGKYKTHLYAVFIVQDDRLVYRSSKNVYLDKNDHLQIVLQEPNQRFYRYLLTPTGPGWVTAYKIPERNGSPKFQVENRIQGVWYETHTGYILELRIPLNQVGKQLGFAVADVDDPQGSIQTIIGTSPIQHIESVDKSFVLSPRIQQTLQSLGETPGRHLWVLDRQRRVSAQQGEEFQRESSHYTLNTLYSLLLPSTSETFKDDLTQALRLEGVEVNNALNGQADIRWSATPDKQTVIVSAAHPIWVGDQVFGVVVVQETSNRIQVVQRQAIANLFNKTFMLFSIVTLVLLVFANRLSVRIRHLRNQAEEAIDIHGRVTTSKIGFSDQDEIGDLSRSFSTILERLQQYNTYLEGMASRLSHELRTPLAVVRSSLENLESLGNFGDETVHDESHIYIERAKEGINRLNTIITRLSEATRLEEILQNAERELFNLTDLVGSCVAGYRLAYPKQLFYADLARHPIPLRGAPDLLAQMLDKLISNAVDFSEENSPIKIYLSQEKQTTRLEVINRGSPLPSEVEQERLFESMVSFRPQSNKREPHLGLGLYMVRLIVGYHGGQVKACNNPEAPGAMFTVLLPVCNPETLLLSTS